MRRTLHTLTCLICFSISGLAQGREPLTIVFRHNSSELSKKHLRAIREFVLQQADDSLSVFSISFPNDRCGNPYAKTWKQMVSLTEAIKSTGVRMTGIVFRQKPTFDLDTLELTVISKEELSPSLEPPPKGR